MTQSVMPLRGKFHIQHLDKDGVLLREFDAPNAIVDAGLNHILTTEFNGGTPITTWLIGLIDNAGFSALANGDTMGSHVGWTEVDEYDEATRPEWTAGNGAARSITNSSTVDFSINAPITIKGIFITSGTAKNGTTGTLWATAAFSTLVNANNGDTLKVTYTVSG